MNTPLRILLVDDDRDVAGLVATVLASARPAMELVSAGSALEFAEALAAGRFAAVLLDASTSWADGLDILDALKRSAPQTPVLLFAATPGERLLGDMFARGVDGWVPKSPRGFVTLPDAIGRAVERRAGAGEDAHWRRIVERARIGVFHCTVDGELLDANPTFLSFFGLGESPRIDVFDLLSRELVSLDLPLMLSTLRSDGYAVTGNVTFARESRGGRSFVLRLCVTDGPDAPPVIVGTLESQVNPRSERHEAAPSGGGAVSTGVPGAPPESPASPSSSSVPSPSSREHALWVAAHDLREPLRTLVRYGEILRERTAGSLDRQAGEYLGFIQDAAARLQAQVNRILSSAEAKQVPADPWSRRPGAPETAGGGVESVGTDGAESSGAIDGLDGLDGNDGAAVDADVALRQALDDLRSAAESTGARITFDRLPRLRVESNELLQLFQNLIGNALKFRGRDTPRVHVSAVRRGNLWAISVSDNGPGVPPEEAESVFEMFHRGRNVGDVPGTGIGLAVCRRIVERHGGCIRVEPGFRGGSVFTFTLPGDADSPSAPVIAASEGAERSRAPAATTRDGTTRDGTARDGTAQAAGSRASSGPVVF